MAAPQDSAAGVSDAAAAEARDREVQDADAIRVCRQLAGVAFPWDITRSLELALLKTFCVPSIAGLLDQTGEFAQRPRKRYDDTGLMVAELLRHGPDSPAGRAVIARMNRIHGHYAIGNVDFLYVLSTFVAEPIRWLQRYGWRSLSDPEQQALFRFWRRVGERMGIAAIPSSLGELLAFNQRFEAVQFAATPANARVAEATLRMLLRDWPAPLRPALRRLLQALPEAAVRRGLNWPEPSPTLQSAIRQGLRSRSLLVNAWMRLFPPRGTRFYSERPTPSYGASFELQQLGPPPLLQALNRPRWSGQQRRIGLTGGIASGKSSVGRLLEAHGLPLLDADVFAREALAPGSVAARAVLERYGDRVRLREQANPAALSSTEATTAAPSGLHPTEALAGPEASAGTVTRPSAVEAAPRSFAGSTAGGGAVAGANQTHRVMPPMEPPSDRQRDDARIDRAALGRIVFSDPNERRWLEQLVHPLVRERYDAELAARAQAPVVVLVIPLLFEAGLEGLCSEIWLVDCDAGQQLQRLMVRDGLREADARARLDAQWPLERKRPLADVVIDNRGEPQLLTTAVAAALGRPSAAWRG